MLKELVIKILVFKLIYFYVIEMKRGDTKTTLAFGAVYFAQFFVVLNGLLVPWLLQY